jgi:hypothetical protein
MIARSLLAASMLVILVSGCNDASVDTSNQPTSVVKPTPPPETGAATKKLETVAPASSTSQKVL